MDPATLVGTTLDGRYEIAKIMASGAMGCVFEAKHTGTGRRVALKIISTGDLAKNKALVARFQREARAAGSIDTQHIAQVLDTGNDPESGLPYLVMEYLAGEDAQRLFTRTGPIAPELALRLIGQSCIGLQKAHEARVIHRDIKPANLFLAHREQEEVIVKLLDFGIAKVKMIDGADSGGLTRTGSMLGSPLYMSPEQARGAKTVDHRADIWSLGIVMYKALAGVTPYEHIDALGELIIVICSEAAKPVQDHAPWVPSDVAAIVHRALLHDPGDRYQSAQEMLDAIRGLLPHGLGVTEKMLVSIGEEEKAVHATKLAAPQEVIQLPSYSPPSIAATREAGRAEPAESAAVPGRERRGKRSLAIAIGATAMVALLGVGGFLATRGGTRGASAPTASAATSESLAVAPARPTAISSERTVKLVVGPEGATVHIDGIEAKPKDGVVDVKGALGSVHKVKLAKGAAKTEVEVVVTEAGARPSKVVLE